VEGRLTYGDKCECFGIKIPCVVVQPVLVSVWVSPNVQ